MAAVTAAIARARSERKHRYLHAFPSVDNPASNAVCRKAGFSLIGECDFEFPPGRLMRSNDRRLDLTGHLEHHLAEAGTRKWKRSEEVNGTSCPNTSPPTAPGN